MSMSMEVTQAVAEVLYKGMDKDNYPLLPHYYAVVSELLALNDNQYARFFLTYLSASMLSSFMAVALSAWPWCFLKFAR